MVTEIYFSVTFETRWAVFAAGGGWVKLLRSARFFARKRVKQPAKHQE
jgi:hypothetical protein